MPIIHLIFWPIPNSALLFNPCNIIVSGMHLMLLKVLAMHTVLYGTTGPFCMHQAGTCVLQLQCNWTSNDAQLVAGSATNSDQGNILIAEV